MGRKGFSRERFLTLFLLDSENNGTARTGETGRTAKAGTAGTVGTAPNFSHTRARYYKVDNSLPEDADEEKQPTEGSESYSPLPTFPQDYVWGTAAGKSARKGEMVKAPH